MKSPSLATLFLLVTAFSAFCATEVRFSATYTSDIPNTVKMKGPSGEPLYVSTTPLVTNQDIQKAYVITDDYGPEISIILKPDSATRVDEALKSLYNHQLAIFVNGQMVSAPTLKATHFGGRMEIPGQFSKAEAARIASDLNAG